MGSLDGKVALVTGSTRGIGRAMVELFAAEGARVVVHGRRQEDADAVASGLPGAVGVGADVSRLEDVQRLVERTNEALGPIDVLVNNAAISTRTAVTRVTDEEWDQLLLVNLTSPFWLTRAVVPQMKKAGGGTILNVTSGAGITGSAGFTSYAAAKGGLVGMSMTLAKELVPFHIRVNLLAPAALTDMLKQLPQAFLDEMGDLPTVDDCARAALALVADPEATGQISHVGQAEEA